MSARPDDRIDPWPLPRIPVPGSVTKGAETALLHDNGCVQIISWACRHDCEELRAERTHSHHVISILKRGACTIEQAGRSATIDTASVVVHRPGATYRTRHPYGLIDAGWSLAYDEETAAEILSTLHANRTPDRPSRLVAVRRHRAFTAPLTTLFRLDRTPAFDSFAAQEAALHLFTLVHDPDAFSWSPSDPARRSDRILVDRACEAMRAHTGDPLRLRDVAVAIGCSEFGIYRAFRRQRGMTPGEYLRRIRLAAVIEGLAGGAESLTDLALETGFASHSHMTAVFRRHFGRTPRSVRSEIRSH